MVTLTPAKLLTDLGIEYSEKTNRLQICCPFHPDTDPSAGFYLDTALFHCFSCEFTFDLIQFYAKYKEITRAQAEQEMDRIYGDVPLRARANQVKIVSVRKRAERLLEGKKQLGQTTHGLLGERLDKILWVYERGKITDDQLDKVMTRWYTEVEAGSVQGLGQTGTAADRLDGEVEEGVCPVPRSGHEDGSVDLE